MANSKQARKRARQTVVRNAHNTALRSRLRTAIKSVRKAIAGGDKAAAAAVFQSATRVIDSIADKQIVHKNTAARNKSRLAAALKGLA
jgi:small subunit ribosomal protein S20